MHIRIIIIIVLSVSVGLLTLLLFVSNNNATPNYTPTTIGHEEKVIPTSTTAEYILDSALNHEDNLQENNNSERNFMNHPSTPADPTPPTPEYRDVQATDTPQLMAWIYPYKPACTAQSEYADGRNIDILKPEFFTINGGSLILLDESMMHCNGYSPAFVVDLKKHSTNQFATVSSASAGDMTTFLQQALTANTAIETLVNFVVKNDFTGIELNFEDFGSWTNESYTDFKTFVTRLGNALQTKNKQLMVVGPPIANAVEEKWFLWRYEDFTKLPINHMVVMGYDYQYDHGAGEAIAPLDWLRNVITWVSARYPQNRLTIALPSYGYESQYGTYQISILTHEQIKTRPGYSTATRDPNSAEMTWQYGDTVYFYQDSVSLAKKSEVVTSLGIHSLSIWHLGGNPWFE